MTRPTVRFAEVTPRRWRSGWTQVEPTGEKEACLAHLDEDWTKITRLSVHGRPADIRGQLAIRFEQEA